MHCTIVEGLLPHSPSAEATGDKPAYPETLGLNSKLTNQINFPSSLPTIALATAGGRKIARDIPPDLKTAWPNRRPGPRPDAGRLEMPAAPHQQDGTGQDFSSNPSPPRMEKPHHVSMRGG